jgi:hypothetical protein
VEPIRFFNRHTGSLETEQVYGEGFLRWTYGHPMGALALTALVKRPLFSAWYGRRMSTPESAARVAPFIARYGLDPAEFAQRPESFGAFNWFFLRSNATYELLFLRSCGLATRFNHDLAKSHHSRLGNAACDSTSESGGFCPSDARSRDN